MDLAAGIFYAQSWCHCLSCRIWRRPRCIHIADALGPTPASSHRVRPSALQQTWHCICWLALRPELSNHSREEQFPRAISLDTRREKNVREGSRWLPARKYTIYTGAVLRQTTILLMPRQTIRYHRSKQANRSSISQVRVRYYDLKSSL